ncbi:MAG: HyaD/HybD family hydrogenase maturation endopeptidase, partial [Candidatus Zixiibacteriota bacterium]
MSDGETTNRPRTAIMGAGNVLMGDDGIGVRVIEVLRDKEGLPDGIEIIDAGTATLDALALVENVDHLIIVDAVKGGQPPGTIYQFSPDDVSEPPSQKISLHQMSLLEALKVGRMLGAKTPRVSIIGVEPKTIAAGTSLSKEVGDQIPNIISAIMSLVADLHP